MRARAAATGLAVLALGVAGAPPAAASSGITATVNIGVRSVSVSPGSIAYGPCSDALGNLTGNLLVFPNGKCLTPYGGIIITVGPLASHIDVQGSDMVPADNGKHWTLTSAPPGADQFKESTVGTANGTVLSTVPACDAALPGGVIDPCGMMGGATAAESLRIVGPSSSTDSSLTFATTVTWTAVP